jgi:asparagine synthase (glutamine-hydrolysing)
MCGFAGFVVPGGVVSEAARAIGEKMGQAIRHRGPDDDGVWSDSAAGVVLSHRRLSIVDLSPAGHQPMLSESGRFVISFNGEIYNHHKLRRHLPRAEWRGHSDTETLLAAIEAWGVQEALKQSIGMFAFALWDRGQRTLTLARDRMGEKPLYYGWQGKGNGAVFLFGSELKALKVHPAFAAEIDRDALCLQLRHNYIPAPYSIYQGVHKLQAGHLLQMSWGGGAMPQDLLPTPVPYWSLAEVAAAGGASSFQGSEHEAVTALDELLRDAIGHQMAADVPLGAFLSGGIDSSTVVALMQAQSSRPVKTFTIGFNEATYNEANYAEIVARHLGTEHTELYVSPRQAMDVIPRLPNLYDEPFSDSSQIPTFLVSQLAKRHVSVSLSGDGGDELFGGYSRYLRAARAWRAIAKLPQCARQGLAGAIESVSVAGWNRLAAPVVSLLPLRMRNVGDKAHKFASLIDHVDQLSFYRQFLTHWDDPAGIVVGGKEPFTFFSPGAVPVGARSYYETMMEADTLNYLPDDILVKVDRAAMGVSLETRVPLLDHRVVEFAWSLPLTLRIRNGQGKWLLRQVLQKYVPLELTDRPKMGFGVPIDTWLRGPLRDWAETLLDESRLRQDGYFNPKQVRQKWTEHLSGQRNWQYHLWDVLMFQAWLAEQ